MRTCSPRMSSRAGHDGCGEMLLMNEDTGDRLATEIQIQLLLQGVRDVLRSDLVGAYLHGSAVLGGFRPDSDIDVIVLSTRRTTADEKRALIDLLLSLSGKRAS